MDVSYVGEHNLLGLTGHLLIIIACISALFSAYCYAVSVRRNDDESWRYLGRIGFRVHSFAGVSAALVLLSMLVQHYFEFDYVWKHSNLEMPMRYVFAAFWEGQEGSNFLWSFWQIVLGNVLIRTAKNWEGPVLAVICLAQVWLYSLLLGIYVFGVKIGSSPFLLLRELPENIGLPWTFIPDYMSRFPELMDGRGLNPLLQNYWMTIHPPTLFLGFAATIVPFAFAIGGLFKKDFTGWIKPAIPWAFFAVMILGTGILMGGAWAYEALSFGGFWAWDPVENASLVPWLTLLGGAHLLVLQRNKPTAIWTTAFLCIASYILIVYSTFLTKSGILGETSVHSFTDSGLGSHLTLYLLFFIALGTLALLAQRKMQWQFVIVSVLIGTAAAVFGYKTLALMVFGLYSLVMIYRAYHRHFPQEKKEEQLWSREFWMFIGSLILLLSAVQISISTSRPVINKLLEPMSGFFKKLYDWIGIEFFQTLSEANLAPPSDIIGHYHKWQLPIAFFIAILVAVGQYFSYGKNNIRDFGKKLSRSIILATLISILPILYFGYGVQEWSYVILLWACIFAIVANADYLIRILKGKIRFAGSAVAHMGFGLVLLGALLSTSRQEVVSLNSSGIDVSQLSEEFHNEQDILLYRGDTLLMNNYFISYSQARKEGVNVFYDVDFFGRTPRSYSVGDTAGFKGMVFICRQTHEASRDFLADQEANWTMIESPANALIKNWTPFTPAQKEFTLSPFIQTNEKFGSVAEPSTKHYLHKDIYTHIRWGDQGAADAPAIDTTGNPDYQKPKDYPVHIGDTIATANFLISVDSIFQVFDPQERGLLATDTVLGAVLTVRDGTLNKSYEAMPMLVWRKTDYIENTLEMAHPGLRIAITNVNPLNGEITFSVAEHRSLKRDFIVLQAIVFPMINLLWIGCIIMVIGILIALRQRIKNDKSSKDEFAA